MLLTCEWLGGGDGFAPPLALMGRCHALHPEAAVTWVTDHADARGTAEA